MKIVIVTSVASSESNPATGLRTVLVARTYVPTNMKADALTAAGRLGKQ